MIMNKPLKNFRRMKNRIAPNTDTFHTVRLARAPYCFITIFDNKYLLHYLKDFGFIFKKYDAVFLEIFRATINPLMPSGNKKVTQT